MRPAVVAVDGGASKTHLALIGWGGEVLQLVRGPESQPHNVGFDRALEVLDGLYAEAAGSKAEVAQVSTAGVGFPSEEQELQEAIESRGWAERTVVGNDTFAVLRAGTERGWGVAVVCGTGINCVGVSSDGQHARFPALGQITGDWGGGTDVGYAALYAAARSEDGRGPKTTLEQAVRAHFGLKTPVELAEEIHRGRIHARRLLELPPVVFTEAEHDAVAAEIVERLASEIVAMARVAMERLDLASESPEVLLGGGLLQSGDGRLSGAVERELRKLSPNVSVTAPSSPPIVGAALLGLDAIGAPAEAQRRARQGLEAAVESAPGEGAGGWAAGLSSGPSPWRWSGAEGRGAARGRAMATKRSVSLMDEPLSNLDAKLRVQMRADIAALQHDLGITTVYVTHDQAEAMTLGHRVAVLDHGQLQQCGTPRDLYDLPANRFVAGFIGSPA